MKTICSLLIFCFALSAQWQGQSGDIQWIISRYGFPCDGQISEAARLCFEGPNTPQGVDVILRSNAIDFDGYRVMLYVRDKDGRTREVVRYADREQYVPGQQSYATIQFHDIGRVRTPTFAGTEVLRMYVNKVRKTDVQPLIVSLEGYAAAPQVETYPAVRMGGVPLEKSTSASSVAIMMGRHVGLVGQVDAYHSWELDKLAIRGGDAVGTVMLASGLGPALSYTCFGDRHCSARLHWFRY